MTAEQDRLASLFGALASATDLGNGFHPEKAVRTALVAQRLAAAHGLEPVDQAEAYYVALLRFLGCTGFAHEEAHRFGGGDDISVRSVMGVVDPDEPLQLVRSIVAGVGRDAPLRRRAHGVVSLLTHPSAAQGHADAQCDVADTLARQLSLPSSMLDALGGLFERWDGKGHPHRKPGADIPVVARVVAAADVLEVVASRHGLAEAAATAERRAGGRFDPAVAVTLRANLHEVFVGLDAGSVWDDFLAAEPEPVRLVSPSLIERYGLAFARAVDLKSVWTATHSHDVGVLAAAAGQAAGLDDATVADLRVGGWLHDLGRLAISNLVWDKPGALNAAEWEQVRLHAYHSERLLARSPALRRVARLVGATHERLDGSGYPRGGTPGELDEAARLLAACDVLCALREDRPHRPGHTADESARILAEEASRGTLDLAAVRHVLAAAGEVTVVPEGPRPAGLTEREVDVLRLVARGATNKEAATALGISAKTVQHHVAHIYTKTGLSSRAGATLFAVEHDLHRA